MFYTLKVIDPKSNIIKFQSEFDRKREVDIKKLKAEYQEKFPKDCVEVE